MTALQACVEVNALTLLGIIYALLTTAIQNVCTGTLYSLIPRLCFPENAGEAEPGNEANSVQNFRFIIESQ